MPTHTVQQGEFLSSIAAQYGYTDYMTVWNDPNNANLKALRKNPNVLLPGDQVYVPDRQSRQENRSTDTKNKFTSSTKQTVLRVKLLDLNNKAIQRDVSSATTGQGIQTPQRSGEIYTIQIEKQPQQQVTLKFNDPPILEIDMIVGALDPQTEVSGQRERLNNLGYFAGFDTSPDPDQFQWAVEEFQCDRKKTLSVDGVCGPNTQAALVKEHGL